MIWDKGEALWDRCIPEPNSGCWLWLMGTLRGGYGQFYDREYRKYRIAHRVSYEVHKGPIPNGLDILHSCDTPSCINPDHLRVGTHQENMNDSKRKGRMGINHSRGESHYLSKLTEEAVREIRSTTGQTTALANKYGVSRTSIKLARRGRTWSHLI